VLHYVAQEAVKEVYKDEQCIELSKVLTGFDPTLFAEGLVDSILETSENMAALANSIVSHPQETVYVLVQDLVAIREDPQVLIGAGLLINESLGAWWEKTKEEKGARASYDMGKLVGTIESRLLTEGVLTVIDTPARVELAVGPRARIDLMSDVFTEKVTSLVEKEIPQASGVLKPLFENMNARMHQTQSPLKLKAFSDTMKNLYLSLQNPLLTPPKKSSIVFLRNEIITSLYSLNPEIIFQGKAFKFVGLLSSLLQAGSSNTLTPNTLTVDGFEVTIYANRLPAGVSEKLVPILRAVQNGLSAGQTPGKNLLIALTDLVIDNLF